MSGKSFSICWLIIIAVLAVLLAVLWPRNGLTARYYAGDRWQGETVHETVDPGIWFRNNIVMNSVYTLNWPYDKLPFPNEFPATSMSWNGFIEVPEARNGAETVARPRQPGLKASLYRGMENLVAPPRQAWTDKTIDHDWAHDQVKPAFPPFTIEWNGWLEAPVSGLYRFTVVADDTATLYINHQLLAQDMIMHRFTPAAGEVFLEKGAHQLRLRYFDLVDRAAVRLLWQPPGAATEPVPESALFHYEREPRGYALALESLNEAWLTVGDLPPVHHPGGGGFRFTPELPPGLYPLSLKLKRSGAQGGVVMYWKTPDGREETVSRRALVPEARQSLLNLYRQVAAGMLAVLLLSMLAFVYLRPRARFSQNILLFLDGCRQRRYALLLAAVILLGLLLRLHQYDVLPRHGETVDEYNCAWSGWSLIHDGVPRGWSWFLVYGDLPATRWFGDNYRIVEPLFEYPPLFSLIIGAAATLGGAREMFHCSLTWMRLPPLLFTTLSIWLIYLLGTRLYGKIPGLLAAGLYACIPLIVVSGRLVKQENMMVPLTLGALLCLLKYFESANPRWRDAAAVMAGLCALTKTTGLYLGVVVIVILLSRNKWRDALRSGIICLAFFSLYLVYGWWYDWETFLAVVEFMGSFTARMDSGLQFIRDSKLVVEIFGSGWNLWLWLALIYASTKEDKTLSLTIIIYWMALAVSACGDAVYGWYRIPLYPLLCLCGGVYLHDLFRKPEPVRGVVFVLACLAASGQYAFPSHWTATFDFCRPFLGLAFLPFLLAGIWQTPEINRLARISLALILAVFLILNIVTVLNFNDAYYIGNIRAPLR